MFVCKECGAVFEELVEVVDVELEHFGRMCHETYLACPVCNSDYYEEANQCDCCGEWITGTYIRTDDGKYYCDNCYLIKDVNE